MKIELNGHLIKKSEIVGIGPLMIVDTQNSAEWALYASRRYFYVIHLRNHDIKIESDWYRFQSIPEDQLADNKKAASEWKQRYDRQRNEIEKFLTLPRWKQVIAKVFRF